MNKKINHIRQSCTATLVQGDEVAIEREFKRIERNQEKSNAKNTDKHRISNNAQKIQRI